MIRPLSREQALPMVVALALMLFASATFGHPDPRQLRDQLSEQLARECAAEPPVDEPSSTRDAGPPGQAEAEARAEPAEARRASRTLFCGWLHLRRAESALEMRQSEGVEIDLAAAARRGVPDGAVQTVRARLARLMGDEAALEAALAAALDGDPATAGAGELARSRLLRLRSERAARAGDWRQAAFWSRSALDAAPAPGPELILFAARMHRAAGELEAAGRILEEGSVLHPGVRSLTSARRSLLQLGAAPGSTQSRDRSLGSGSRASAGSARNFGRAARTRSSRSEMELGTGRGAPGPPSVVRGPYLQRTTPESTVVRWRTDVAARSRVAYATDLAGPWREVLEAGTGTEHVVELQGLDPATRYFYAIGTESDLLEEGSHLTFRTAPPIGSAAPTRVWILGDSGTANADAAAVRDAFVTFNGSPEADVWLMLGDNAYPDGTDEEYQAAVFDTYPEHLQKMALWPVLGNHDARSADSPSQTGAYFEMFSLPTSAEAGGMPSGTEAYYSFDHANVHFIALDSHDSDRTVGGAMYDWLLDDLASTTHSQTWIVAFWHHPPYSKGSHDSDTEARLVQMRENFLPLLESYGVDLVFAGHSHSYERSYLLDSHFDFSPSLEEWMKLDPGDGDPLGDGPYRKSQHATQSSHDGSVYVVAGSSGRITSAPLDHPAMVYSAVEFGSVVLDFEGSEVVVRFLDDAANVLDEFRVVKDDEALFDYGDAPEPGFPTSQSSNGARHRLVNDGPRLGATVTSEEDGQPGPNAGTDQGDDGVALVSELIPDRTASFEVSASSAGRLDAWLDWNADGAWDRDDEQVVEDLLLAAGAHRIEVDAPSDLGSEVEVVGRFRFSSRGGLGVLGKAFDGEVEDHVFRSAALADLSVNKTDGLDRALAGETLRYTVTVSNAGPADIVGARVVDTLPPDLLDVRWWCAPAEGAGCRRAGVGDVDELVDLSSGTQVTFTIDGELPTSFEGEVSGSVTVTAPAGVHDAQSSNDTATDRTLVLPGGASNTETHPVVLPDGFPPSAVPPGGS